MFDGDAFKNKINGLIHYGVDSREKIDSSGAEPDFYFGECIQSEKVENKNISRVATTIIQ